MKKILGLDLGVSSIGWAIIEEDEKGNRILGMGTRIIPLTADDKTEFSQGNAISKNQKRTQKRTQRKGYDRYQQRRLRLTEKLKSLGMMPEDDLMRLNKKELWNLRAKAAFEKVELKEIGRVLYHLNQKRGYKSSRSEENMNKKDTEYVAAVKTRHEKIKELNLTVGQYFARELNSSDFYRIKDQVFPREAYVEEFEAIMNTQQKFYPDLLTDTLKRQIRDEIIFYQRKLKSQKNLVSVCEFEGVNREVTDENGKRIIVFTGPKVAPRSSPLFQIEKVWETINSIRIENKNGEEYWLTNDDRMAVFNYLQDNETLSQAKLYDILKLKKDGNWISNKLLQKGLQGNLTRTRILKCFDNPDRYSDLLEFKPQINETGGTKSLINRKTGEVTENISEKIVDSSFEQIPFYRLWHVIYSIPDQKECSDALVKNFNIPYETAEKLSKIDFTRQGFGNKSAKAIRKILPYLIDGYVYSDACSLAGYRHSDSLTTSENIERQLAERLKNIEKNSLRQPVVEKILNQMINVVNALMDKYGKPDEIRVELARELKQSREERNSTYKNLSVRERENKEIAERLEKEYGIRATRNNILKWRLFHSVGRKAEKINDRCIYCGDQFGITAALLGEEVDIEHIIPRSKLFDDSQNNKILAHRKCNQEKGEMTAFDYMKTKSQTEFQNYVNRVNELCKSGIINKIKRDRLLMTESKIPRDFINRQLNETRYISRKSTEILSLVCRNVFCTTGSVTEYLRNIWGWNDILMRLNLPKYREAGLTEIEEIESDGQKIKNEIIRDWSKRNDHRHHAVDALTIACTKQSYIQRINNLSSSTNREDMYKEIEDIEPRKRYRRSLLDNYLAKMQPFTTKQVEEAASKILVSFKPGKKVATPGVRKIKRNRSYVTVQKNIIVPRGALSEETVYGKIKIIETNKPVKYLFENPELIFKSKIKSLVKERLDEYNGDASKALKSLKVRPVFLDDAKTTPLTYGTCFKEEYIVKYPVGQIKAKDIESVIDPVVRRKLRERLEKFGNKEKDAFKNLDNDPIWYNEEQKIPIKTVRCRTGLESVEPVRKDHDGKPVAFVKPGNNHHIAIYRDQNGKLVEHLCTFWHAVERKKYGIPVIIDNSDELFNLINLRGGISLPQDFLSKLPGPGLSLYLSMQQNEMFILGLQHEDIEKLFAANDYPKLSNYLYRVQKLASFYYVFRHHLETELIDTNEALMMKRFYRIQSLKALNMLNPVKVRVSLTGEIAEQND